MCAVYLQLLEDAQKTQQQIYEEEVKRMQEIQDREAKAAERALQEEQELVRKYQDKLYEMAKREGGKCFVYPASHIPYGACASAGAQEPCRRKRRERREAAKGCC